MILILCVLVCLRQSVSVFLTAKAFVLNSFWPICIIIEVFRNEILTAWKPGKKLFVEVNSYFQNALYNIQILGENSFHVIFCKVRWFHKSVNLCSKYFTRCEFDAIRTLWIIVIFTCSTYVEKGFESTSWNLMSFASKKSILY